MLRFLTWRGAALAALLIAIPLTVYAGVAFKNLDPETARRHDCYRLQVAATSNDLGDDGVVFKFAHGTGTSIDEQTTFGVSTNTSFAVIPYPSVLSLGLQDITANDTLTCSSVAIKGYDQFGRPRSETITGVTETMGAAETTYAYSQIYSVVATCSAGTDATDALVIGTGLKVGLPARARTIADIESACIADASDSNAIKCTTWSTGDTADLESNVTLLTDVYDTSVAQYGAVGGTEVAAADADELCVAVRSGWNYR